MTIQITVNGEERRVAQDATLSTLFQELGLTPETAAALRNDEVVERAHFDAVQLEQGDVVEIVRFVPGG